MGVAPGKSPVLVVGAQVRRGLADAPGDTVGRHRRCPGWTLMAAEQRSGPGEVTFRVTLAFAGDLSADRVRGPWGGRCIEGRGRKGGGGGDSPLRSADFLGRAPPLPHLSTSAPAVPPA